MKYQKIRRKENHSVRACVETSNIAMVFLSKEAQKQKAEKDNVRARACWGLKRKQFPIREFEACELCQLRARENGERIRDIFVNVHKLAVSGIMTKSWHLPLALRRPKKARKRVSLHRSEECLKKSRTLLALVPHHYFFFQKKTSTGS